LKQLQRKDGSFNDIVEEEGDERMGVRDVRFVYLAASVRWMLRGKTCDVEDIDVDGAVRFINSAQVFQFDFSFYNWDQVLPMFMRLTNLSLYLEL